MRHPSLAAVAAAALLGACAAGYVPSSEPGAAKVRVRNLSTGILSNVTPFTRPVGASGCGTRVGLPQLSRIGGETAAAPIPGSMAPVAPPRTYPRLGMLGGNEPTRTDNAELLIAPGRHQFEFHASSPRYCRIDAHVHLESGRQYEVNFAIDAVSGVCKVGFNRLEGATWVESPRAPPTSCPG